MYPNIKIGPHPNAWPIRNTKTGPTNDESLLFSSVIVAVREHFEIGTTDVAHDGAGEQPTAAVGSRTRSPLRMLGRAFADCRHVIIAVHNTQPSRARCFVTSRRGAVICRALKVVRWGTPAEWCGRNFQPLGNDSMRATYAIIWADAFSKDRGVKVTPSLRLLPRQAAIGASTVAGTVMKASRD